MQELEDKMFALETNEHSEIFISREVLEQAGFSARSWR